MVRPPRREARLRPPAAWRITTEGYLYLAAGLLCVLTLVQGTGALWGGVRFHRYVAGMLARAKGLRTASGGFAYQPKAAVILPCCGVDDKLEHTVAALAGQNYPDYEVIFTFESEADPAYEVIGAWVRSWPRPAYRRVVAGLADSRGQKIHNLLAALAQVSPDREVLVFLDSDAVPGPDWLGHLVAPLRDRQVGAATGYRWYAAAGGIAAGIRCAWNAATVTLLDDERLNFCWGGATAIRRDTFEGLGVAERWHRALSDDYQLTRAVRAGGLRIRFVPQALVSSSDRTTLRAFWQFARRQVIITRVCAPAIWRAGLLLTANFVAGGTAAAVLFFVAALGWFGNRTVMWSALVAWAVILLLAAGKPVLRQLALRQVLRPPDLTWRDFVWDVFGTIAVSGMLHLGLFAASLGSRRIVWRNTEYEMVSAEVTRVLGRRHTDEREHRTA